MDVVERLSPDEAEEPNLLALTHIHRYHLAREICAGLRVLDLCCGSGYGSRLVAERADAVLGVDVHAPSIERAVAETEPGGRLRFECADALEVLARPLGEEFDAIVLFEGLEHLAELDRAVELLGGHVASGTGLIVSLPNSRAYGEENPHHMTEFDYEQAIAAFERLGATSILFQFHAEGSLIRAREDGPLGGSSTLADRAEPEHCNHLIAVANLESRLASEAASARMQVSVAPAFNTYMLELERLNERLWRTNLRLARERLGIDDSAAAAALERLRLADEQAAAKGYRSAFPGPVARLLHGVRRIVVMVLPHGLIVAWGRFKSASPEDDEDTGPGA